MSDVPIKNGIVIPANEIEITASRSGGPGGQHVQKTSSKVTLRWNIPNSRALTDDQKERILQKLSVTQDGDFIIHASTSRSQQQNRQDALQRLATAVSKALVIPKKRMRKTINKAMQEARLREKARRSSIKKLRGKIHDD